MTAARSRPPNRDDASPLVTLRAQLEQRLEECARHMEAGVNIMDPATTYIGLGVRIGPGTTVYPNTTITGETDIGPDCHIGPNSIISDSRIAAECQVLASVIEGAVIEDGVDIGPFSHIRPGTHVESGVHIGNFVEIKASRLGAGTKVGHFSYVGDARIGRDVNVGAGTVTCNYDGAKKNRTVIEEGAFIGSDTMLVAPVTVGKRAVPDGATVAGVPARPTGKPPRTAQARKNKNG